MQDSDSDVIIPHEPDENVVVRWFMRPVILVALATAAGLYIAGPHLWSMLPDLSSRGEYRLKVEQISFTTPPVWIPTTFLQQVVREGGLPADFSLLDDGVVDQVAAAFQKNPWVERVISVRKDFTRRLTVALEYRKPVAIVLMQAEQYPVDRKAVLLPPPELPDGSPELPVIRNARTSPSGPVGSPWGDPIVEGAARIADVLGPAWKRLRLESIDMPIEPVKNASIEKTVYVMRMLGGSRIIWGTAPGTNRPGELTPEQKISRLDEYQTRRGELGEEDSPYEIDVRHGQDIVRRPLSERPGLSRQ